jgi:DNA-binding NtrC family response regulator
MEKETLESACKRFRFSFIVLALAKSGWNQQECAEMLGVHRNTLSRDLKQMEGEHFAMLEGGREFRRKPCKHRRHNVKAS